MQNFGQPLAIFRLNGVYILIFSFGGSAFFKLAVGLLEKEDL
jgi:hypothetical protein